MLNSPESDSARLGGNTSPSVATHESVESNGKHRFSLVCNEIDAGNPSEFLVEENGAIEVATSGSVGPSTSAGVQPAGSFLSPNCISRAKRCLTTTALANGRSVIRFALTRFA